jgi:hypothetical protein
MADENLIGKAEDPKVAAVRGEHTGPGGAGVVGISTSGRGVYGKSEGSKGVVGESEGFHGVFGHSVNNVGVAAESDNAEAMNAFSHSPKHAAIIAVNDKGGPGVHGHSGPNVGVVGESNTGRGVHGVSNTNFGVSGISKQSTGVLGRAEGTGSGVIGESLSGIGVHGKGGILAGKFEGNVEVTGTINGQIINDLVQQINKLKARSPRSIRIIYRNVQGRVKRTFNWEGLTESSAVVITAAEWKAGVDPFDSPPGRPHLGNANVYVTNVGPHDPEGDFGGVEFYLHVDVDRPLHVLVTITNLGPIEKQIVSD